MLYNIITFQVIAAEGEMNASRALKEAADIISESPSALQLRYLQTLTTISAEKNSTVLFPLPVDFLSRFLPERKGWSPRDRKKTDTRKCTCFISAIVGIVIFFLCYINTDILINLKKKRFNTLIFIFAKFVSGYRLCTESLFSGFLFVVACKVWL